MKQILEGSRAIALTIKNIKPNVISAYPITPQTHIVEDLAKFKADGTVSYEYVRAESEFAAASIVAGASATGVRVYSATSSQGLLLMAEVIFNIAGMRLPIVLTCANRAISAPINIWNDHQDAMTIRDAGWIMLFAENHQEAVDQHIMAYKLAEQLNLPVMVNIDGFILTHSYEPVFIPTEKQIKKYLPDYKPKIGEYLDPKNPTTLGYLATPEHYMDIRQDLHDKLTASQDTINKEYNNFQKIFKTDSKLKIKNSPASTSEAGRAKFKIRNSGLVEYYGPKNPKTIIIAIGSVVGTVKDTIESEKNVGVLKIKCYRPFPEKEILSIIQKTEYVAVLDKAISLGGLSPFGIDVLAVAQGKTKVKIKNYIVGLGGRDITKKMIKNIIVDVKKGNEKLKFIG